MAYQIKDELFKQLKEELDAIQAAVQGLHPTPHSATLLDAVTADSSSAGFIYPEHNETMFFIKAASVTSGATVKIQAQAPDGEWHDLHSILIAANGTEVVRVEGHFEVLRAIVTGRTDGTYTVSARGS